jgi:Holliday junction resolvase RusA-like endonuclease
VPGKPCAQQSVRFTRSGHRYQPAAVLAYHDKIGFYAQQARNGCGLMEGPLEVSIAAYFVVARSWSKKRQLAAQWHTQRPDVDNLVKSILDGLKGILFRDDAQVARIVLEKRWTHGPEHLEVVVAELTPARASVIPMTERIDDQKITRPGGGPGRGSILDQQRCRN